MRRSPRSCDNCGEMTEWNAAQYDHISALQHAMAQQVLALLALKGSERVLDIGCGNGKVTAEIAARLPHGSILGVDASREMVAFAQRQFPPPAHPNLRFDTGDARNLVFDPPFDVVVSFNALHWIPDQDTALNSIHASLKPGGTAQLRLVPSGERKSLETVLEETRQTARWAEYFQDFRDPYLRWNTDQYRAAAERHGFTVRSIQTRLNAWNFETRENFAGFGAVTFVEWTRRLPESARPAFITDVLDRYQAAACDKPGEENTFKFYQMDLTLTR